MGKMVLISSFKVFVEADAWVWVLVTWTFSGFITALIASFKIWSLELHYLEQIRRDPVGRSHILDSHRGEQ